jgi:uncharacterized protein YbcV (DUF1398 family)
MEQSVEQVIARCAAGSQAGTLSFGEVVAALSTVGVEAYFADYRAKATTYYLPTGDARSLTLSAPEVAIGQAFDAEALQEAIRGSQRGELKYPEFKRRSMAAGCVGYVVWIAGRQVTYFGRRGEQHREPFPPT